MNSATIPCRLVATPCTNETDAPRERLNERLRGQDEAKAQGRKQRLAEGPNIDHAPGAIDALQSRERAPAIEELAVVIILDNPGAGALRGGEQRKPPLQAHHVTEWLLMRRRHKGRPELRAETQSFLDPDALLVDWHRDKLGAARD